MSTAVVSFSGGQDSTTCLFNALMFNKIVHAVTIDYGQRHAREIVAAKSVISRAQAHYPDHEIKHHVLRIPASLLASNSPLTSENSLETYESPEQMENVIGDRVELTFIPGRNLLFAALLVPMCARVDADELVLGICAADNANYPDCQPAFYEMLGATIRAALGSRKLHLSAPLLMLDKAASVRMAMTLRGCYEALAWSHTAYSGEYPPVTQDHATVLRADGFAKANVPDPLLVRAFAEGKLTQRPPLMLDSERTLADVMRRVGAL